MKKILMQGKSIFYTLIIVFLCIVDQRRGSAPGQVQFVFVNLAGVAVCLLMFSAYKLKDFLKIPYWLWTGIYWIGAVVVTYFSEEVIQYRGQWYTALLNVWLMGLLAIKIITKFWFEKWRPSFSVKALGAFLLFMLIACLSENDSLWTWWYLFLYGMLYLTELSVEDKKRLLDAVLNGIIISFFIIQGLAFVFRPYDILRYSGFYANPNINALFYSLVYCAFLTKYCMYFCRDKKIKHCRLSRSIVLLFCGAMWSFVCLTMCRTAMISMALTTVCAGIYCLCKVRKKIIRNAVGMIVGLLLSIVICAPTTYCAVRYIPAFFHHPIWFEGEYYTFKVHSFDPIDSPKYVSWERVLEAVLGRWKAVDLSDLIVKDENNQIRYIVSIDSEQMVARLVKTHTSLLNQDSAFGVNVRTDIFRYYLERLNMRGHTNDDEEAGFQLNETSWVPHAHNLFLQMGFWFGIPAMIFFIVWLSYGIITAGKRAFGESKDAMMMSIFLFYINIVAFGMLEIVWLTGQMPFTLLFLMPLFVFSNNAKRIDISAN